MTQHEHKQFVGFSIKDADDGTVSAIVATVDVIDRDKDIVRASAFPPKSDVVMSGYAHDVLTGGRPPVGRGTLAVEGMHAVFNGKVLLATQAGRETFEILKDIPSEWSFGFSVVKSELPSEAERKAGAVRVITKLLPVEVSPVLIGAGVGTRTLAVKSSDEQRELAAIASANEQREALILKAAFDAIAHDHEPAPGAHLIPPVVRERLDEVAEYTRKVLDLPELEVRFYQPAPGETRYGFRRKSRPNVAYVAIGKPAEQMALTIAHEAMHVAGYVSEGAAEYGAELIVKRWEDRQVRTTPYGFPLDLYDHGPTVGSCGMFPPTGGL